MRLDHLLSKDIFGKLLLEKFVNVLRSVLKVHHYDENFKTFVL